MKEFTEPQADLMKKNRHLKYLVKFSDFKDKKRSLQVFRKKTRFLNDFYPYPSGWSSSREQVLNI